jgi:hypothetical protein
MRAGLSGTGAQPEPVEAESRRHGDGHTAEHARERGLRGVEVGVGVEPDHAEPLRARALQSGEHAERAVAVAEERERKAVPLPEHRDALGEVRAVDSDLVPSAVLALLGLGKLDRVRAIDGAARGPEPVRESSGEDRLGTSAEMLAATVEVPRQRDEPDPRGGRQRRKVRFDESCAHSP